jgi:hypothetical protein
VQVSFEGLLGLIASPQEGLELNLLGLGVGVDLNCPGLRLPFVGRLGLDSSLNGKRCVPELTDLNSEAS